MSRNVAEALELLLEAELPTAGHAAPDLWRRAYDLLVEEIADVDMDYASDAEEDVRIAIGFLDEADTLRLPDYEKRRLRRNARVLLERGLDA